MWNWLKSGKSPGLPENLDSKQSAAPPPVPREPPPAPLPAFVAAVDVETTGLSGTDKIVSLGAVWLATDCLHERVFPVSYLHLIFNPGRKSHPAAARVHGLSDKLLSNQDPFSTYAPAIAAFLNSANVIVAHNASFDLGFIVRELAACGQRIARPHQCTMQAYRAVGTGSASLNSACAAMGLKREGTLHGALEDAWLALMLWLCLHGHQDRCQPFQTCGSLVEMFNLRPPPIPG